MNCIFSKPVYWDSDQLEFLPLNGEIKRGDTWLYSEANCSSTEQYEVIENSTTGASWILEKTFSYGDFFVMFILTIFVLIKVVEIIFGNFFKNV